VDSGGQRDHHCRRHLGDLDALGAADRPADVVADLGQPELGLGLQLVAPRHEVPDLVGVRHPAQDRDVAGV
jgi:hypothetical protein